MKNKILKVSFVTALSFFIFINITDTINAQEIPVPNKTEFIKVNNQKVPVFHFDDPDEADLHRIKLAEANQKLFNLTNKHAIVTDKIETNEVESKISPYALATKYTYKGYNGTAPYKYKFNVYENRTKNTLKIKRTVIRDRRISHDLHTCILSYIVGNSVMLSFLHS